MGSRAFTRSLTPLCLWSLGSAPCPSGSARALAVLQATPPAQLLHGRRISDANGREPRGPPCPPASGWKLTGRAGAGSQKAGRWDPGRCVLWPGNPGRCRDEQRHSASLWG